MKLCRFNSNQLGVVQGDEIVDVSRALDVIPAVRYPLPVSDPMILHFDEVRARINQLLPSAPRLPLAEATLLSPIASPGKLVAAPVNYRKHLEEARADAQIHHNNQLAEIQRVGLFLKANSSLVGAGNGVELRHAGRRNDHEIELAVVIGRTGSRIAREDAWNHIVGYCIGLDMTARGPEERSLRKSSDTYSVLGPWMVTADELTDPTQLDFWLTVNGEVRQRANTRDLILGIAELIEFASSFYTLHAGDVLFTGTPEGVGPVQPGDVIEAYIEGIGTMQVDVRAG
ncbi:MAG TPA: fumarylacetoacetate hydrolase family protein [Pusillimonas sp.]|uniref:fumarylacetoacetate hydrolase family protein n=1 Tax=Pusillimonas sp. TaxID=3040095 RepID=UPI002B4B049F|nr:fumarylacetoacetate hydrolase family protein [Pusillimonas sp.]HLU18693.1 fumarylacetoacetate hydrolase family protein [Pusillimonas sp.]